MEWVKIFNIEAYHNYGEYRIMSLNYTMHIHWLALYKGDPITYQNEYTKLYVSAEEAMKACENHYEIHRS